jgi:hypothetical protein
VKKSKRRQGCNDGNAPGRDGGGWWFFGLGAVGACSVRLTLSGRDLLSSLPWHAWTNFAGPCLAPFF